jgi:hypothetical protein
MGLFRVEKRTGIWWRDHSLSIVLLVILLAQTAVSLFTGWNLWRQERPDTSQGFMTWWLFEYTTSVVADTYGVLLIVWLSKFFVERGSV